jgi:phosphatidylinositol alpha-1,6-mannosyltransferase
MGAGGVAIVSRLLAEVLREEPAVEVEEAIFTQSMAPWSWLPRKVQYLFFSWRCRVALRTCSHVLYDSPNMARMHRHIARPEHRSLVFIHGIEVWENAHPAWIAACRQADMIVANSRYTLERATRLHGSLGSNTAICELATLPGAGEVPQADRSERSPSAMIVGRIDAKEDYKGHRELIEAWPAVVAAVPGAILHIVGKGSGLESLRALAAQGPCADAIVFHGFVSDAQLDSLYRQATVFAMPSRGEGFGLVYIEAMRYRLPLITSRQDAGQEVIADGETGIAVDMDQPGALTEVLIRLLSDRALAERLGEAGYVRWKERFTYEAFRLRMSAILDRFFALPCASLQSTKKRLIHHEEHEET